MPDQWGFPTARNGSEAKKADGVFSRVSNILSRFGLNGGVADHSKKVLPINQVGPGGEHNVQVPSPNASATNWLTDKIRLDQDRATRYNDYTAMIEHGLIKSAVNMISSDSTTKDLIDREKVHIVGTNDEVVADLENLFRSRLDMNHRLKGIISYLITYGNRPMEIIVDDPKMGVMGLRPMDVRLYSRIEDEMGRIIKFEERQKMMSSQDFDPAQVVDFELRQDGGRFTPYGEPLIEGSRRAWKQMKLMEDTIMIYRMERAVERRVFYIDVGNMGLAEAEAYVDIVKEKFKKQKYWDTQTGTISERYNPMETTDDFYLPVTAATPNSKIDQLAAGAGLGEIDDILMFKQNMLAPLTIPSTYMADQYQAGTTKGSLAQEDINYARTVESVQDSAIAGLYKIAYVHLMLKGYSVVDLVSFTINLTPPSDIAELVKLTAEAKRMEIVQSATAIGMSKKSAFIKYLHFNDEEAEEEVDAGVLDAMNAYMIQNGIDPFTRKPLTATAEAASSEVSPSKGSDMEATMGGETGGGEAEGEQVEATPEEMPEVSRGGDVEADMSGETEEAPSEGEVAPVSKGKDVESDMQLAHRQHKGRILAEDRKVASIRRANMRMLEAFAANNQLAGIKSKSMLMKG